MTLWGKAGTIFDRCISLFAVLAGALITFMIFGVSCEVAVKLFAGKPLAWMTEIVEYSLLWVTFLGTAWVLKNEAHIKMDMVVSRLNPRNQALLNMVISILGAILCLIITWYSARVTWQHFQTGFRLVMFLSPPAALIDFIIPVGFISLVIQFIRRAYEYFKRLGNIIRQSNMPWFN